MPRVTPSRHPELSGGVRIFSLFTAKIFAEVHSATSPRSLSMTTSSNPSLAASETAQTLLSQEMLFTPARGDVAWRPCSRKARRTGSRCAGRKADSPDRQQCVVMKDVGVNHTSISLVNIVTESGPGMASMSYASGEGAGPDILGRSFLRSRQSTNMQAHMKCVQHASTRAE